MILWILVLKPQLRFQFQRLPLFTWQWIEMRILSNDTKSQNNKDQISCMKEEFRLFVSWTSELSFSYFCRHFIIHRMNRVFRKITKCKKREKQNGINSLCSRKKEHPSLRILHPSRGILNSFSSATICCCWCSCCSSGVYVCWCVVSFLFSSTFMVRDNLALIDRFKSLFIADVDTKTDSMATKNIHECNQCFSCSN